MKYIGDELKFEQHWRYHRHMDATLRKHVVLETIGLAFTKSEMMRGHRDVIDIRYQCEDEYLEIKEGS